MDLRPDLDDLFRSLDKDCVQRRIRRAERAGLVEKCRTSDELLNVFYGLFGDYAQPTSPASAPVCLVSGLGSLPRQGARDPRSLSKTEIPIAAILTLTFRETGYFKYGCSDPRFNKFAATPWLLWRAIVAAKSRERSNLIWDERRRTTAGLLAFKNHWVSPPPTIDLLEISRHACSLIRPSGWKLKMAKRVFSHVPNSLLVASGKLIYRHIG